MIDYEKLKELTKPEPKYKIGTEVFVLMGEEIRSFKIHEIIDEDSEYWYLNYIDNGCTSHDGCDFDQYREDILFPTRQALIGHKIEYWQNLSEPVEKVEQSQYVPDCEHEPDGREHCFNDSGGHFKMNKCIKCGEFYR